MALFSHGKIVTILQYFTDRVEDYWHILYPLVEFDKRQKDKFLYFYDVSKKAIDYKGEFSSDGIYLFYGYDGKYHLHTLELAQYSLACWVAWRNTGKDEWQKRALLHCDWLCENQEDDGAWRIEHKNPSYQDLPTPWPSALAQAFAISSLIRAYYFTKKEKYLDAAKRATDFLQKDIKDSGVKKEFVLDGIEGFIYEEYPREHLSGVLNGYISVLLAIYELSQVDKEYRLLFEENIENLKAILPLYDCRFWSYYSLDKNIASGFYHRLVVNQLMVLSEFDQDFFNYYKKFKKYQDNKFFALKAFVVKIRSKL